MTRRQFFAQTGAFGIASTALATLLRDDVHAQSRPAYLLAATPKAKRIIFLSMVGAPSQLDLFDHKPKLLEMDGKPVPESLIKGDRFAFIRGIPNLERYFWDFKQHGQSGATISTLMPHLASVADDITFVKSMYATQFNHGPAQIFMNTGFQVIGRPSFGAWVSYGIGTDSKDLPAFVVLLSGESQPDGGSA